MAIALVVNAGQNSPGTGNGFTGASIDTTGANFIVIAFQTHATGSGQISDSKSNTWTQLTEYNVGGNRYISLYYAENATTGTGHTFTCSGTGNIPSMCIAAFSGVATSSSFDVQNGAAGGVVDAQPGSITPGVNNELLVAGLCFDESNIGSLAIDSSFTIANSYAPGIGFAGGALAYQIQTTATARNPKWTWSSIVNSVSNIASFKEGGGGGGTKAIPIFARPLRIITRKF